LWAILVQILPQSPILCSLSTLNNHILLWLLVLRFSLKVLYYLETQQTRTYTDEDYSSPDSPQSPILFKSSNTNNTKRTPNIIVQILLKVLYFRYNLTIENNTEQDYLSTDSPQSPILCKHGNNTERIVLVLIEYRFSLKVLYLVVTQMTINTIT
jgi:hypothetical protein